MKLKFIDLCAGIGGFHYALHNIGWECVYASEIDKTAREVYENNFKKISPKIFHNENEFFNDDIFKFDTNEKIKKIPDFDAICAGFPCQPFSQIGKKKGFGENYEGRGNIFFKLIDIIEIKKPEVIFLENVRHITKHDEGRTFKRIESEIRKLDYSFYHKVIRASDFGLPQHRPRTFMIGFKNERIEDSYFKFPASITLKNTISDIFGGSCDRDIGFTLRLGGMGSGINDRRNWDSYMVDGKVVKLQPLHALKMQGFNTTFKLPKSRTVSLRLLGNSVAVNVVKHIGLQIEKYLTSKKEFKKNAQIEIKI